MISLPAKHCLVALMGPATRRKNTRSQHSESPPQLPIIAEFHVKNSQSLLYMSLLFIDIFLLTSGRKVTTKQLVIKAAGTRYNHPYHQIPPTTPLVL